MRDAALAREESVAHARQVERVGAERLKLTAAPSKPGGAGEVAVGDDHRLEQPAHFADVLADETPARLLELLGPLGRAFGQRLGAGVDADLAQEIALVDRPVHGGARGAGAARHRGEIDVRGDVAFAGLDQRVDDAMAAHRLQRVAERGDGVAVVDEQREPALPRQPPARARRSADARPGWSR